MTDQVGYGPPGAMGVSPLPRAHVTPLTIVVALLALAALVLPPLLLAAAGGGAAGAWRIFKDGGASMYLLLMLDLAMPAVAAALGALVMRGMRVPSALLFTAAAVPFGMALLGAWTGQRVTIGALSGESVDPEQKARILAEGIAESMSNDIFGGFVVCGVAIVAAVAAASALASINVAAVSRGGPKPPATGATGAAVAGGAWLFATIAIGGIRMRTAGGLAFLPVLPVIVLVPFAVLAGRGASVLRGWHDGSEATRAAGAGLVAAFSAVLALLALQRGIEASFTARAFEAIAGESVDTSQRARILAEALDAGRLGAAAYAIHAVFGAATFGLALVPALGGGRHPLSASALVTTALAALLLASAVGVAQARSAAPHAMARSSAFVPTGVTLPVSVETFSDKGAGSSYGERAVVMKDGTGEGSFANAESCGIHHVTLYADRAATVAMVGARLPRVRDCAMSFSFVTQREHPPDIEVRLGDLAAFLGTTGYVTASLGELEWSPKPDTMRVKSIADDAIEIDGVRVALPIPPGTPPAGAAGSRISRVHYTFRPADTVDRALAVVAAAETLYQTRLVSYSLARVIAIDDGTTTAPAASDFGLGIGLGNIGGAFGAGTGTTTPAIKQGAAQINGRLPPEVIQRIVRQNFGRFRLCYEQGLKTNPSLSGRVKIRFVIGKTGEVSGVSDGGSDLPDKSVVACVVKAFGNLSFPQPEGGIVTVVYPLVFGPS
jgi:hypothetical protein